ncbi:MAG: arginase [Trueperaceae bacterium]
MSDIAILGIPMDLGAGRRGVDMGPSALRLAKLESTLADIGHRVADLGNVEVPVPEALARSGDLRFVETIADTCRRAFETLAALPATTVPVSLGGDHSVSMGTVAGAAARGGRTGVVWVDAHADLNTPETSPSLNIHGMPLAHLLGRGHAGLLEIWGGGAVVRPEDVVFIGLRALDDGEQRLVRELGLKAFTMKDVDCRGIASIAAEALEHLAQVDRVHLSFDADALEPDLAPGVGTPVPGGLSYREAHLLMELFADAGVVESVDLVEVNPFLDEKNRTARIMVEMAASLLGKRIL